MLLTGTVSGGADLRDVTIHPGSPLVRSRRWTGHTPPRRSRQAEGLCYIHAEGYPSGELKQGPNALVGEDVPRCSWQL